MTRFLGRKYTLELLLAITLTSCMAYEKTIPYKNIIVRKANDSIYELELGWHRIGQGFSIHNFSWDKYDSKESVLFYVNKITGEVNGEDITISTMNGLINESDRKFKGTLKFDSVNVIFDLQSTFYDSTSFEPYYLNGTYKLTFINDSIR